MENCLLTVVLFLLSAGIKAQEAPLWLHYGAISPDGTQIAFCYKGDIYKVPSTGGRATQLTTHPGYDTRPVWSPDSKSIAYASNREGGFDVYLVSSEGGTPKRLTTHASNEYPVAFRGADKILFTVNILQYNKDTKFPSYAQLHEVSTNGGRPSLFSGSSRPTATLGAFYDDYYKGNGLLIKDIINQGPLFTAKTKINKGSIITKIDGKPIENGQEYYQLLYGKAGKKVLVSFKTSESAAEEEEWIKPITHEQQNNLLYKRWIEQRRQMVHKLSNGRIGYMHVRSMDSNNFRDIYSELLGCCRNNEAVVVDTRYYGGGWLHDDLLTLLGGKEYQRFVSREQYISSDPFNKWTKPSVVLVCENNYPNAHGFPWSYKELGVGKPVGTPVPGTMTAVWWEYQIDSSSVFGIPQIAVKDMHRQNLENQKLFPDIKIYNDPASVLHGKDMQLEKPVEVLLKGK